MQIKQQSQNYSQCFAQRVHANQKRNRNAKQQQLNSLKTNQHSSWILFCKKFFDLTKIVFAATGKHFLLFIMSDLTTQQLFAGDEPTM